MRAQRDFLGTLNSKRVNFRVTTWSHSYLEVGRSEVNRCPTKGKAMNRPSKQIRVIDRE
jgi:hypothetical protein